jgi:Flp pilus assembly protein TadD
MYLPLASVVLAVVLGVEWLLHRAVRTARTRQWLGATFAVLGVLVLGGATWRRNEDYSSTVRIWQDTVEKRPRNPRAEGNLGAALVRAGRPADAVAPLETALQLAPDYAAARATLVAARRAVAAGALSRGETRDALLHLRRAAALAPQDAAALNDLSWVLATCADDSLRDPAAALVTAERAARLTVPRDATILDTLAAAYAATGQFDAARSTALQACALAVSNGQHDLAARITARAALYARGTAYRTPAR